MLSAFNSSLLATVIVSLISLIGVLTIRFKGKTMKRVVLFLVYMSVGALFGDTFIHLLPEAYANNPRSLTSLAIIGGLLLFFILEKILKWRHSHEVDEPHHPQHQNTPGIEPYAYTVIAGDALHNFIDGLLIAASFLINPTTGIATTIAVVAHEIPQEFGDYAILLHTGMRRGQALLWNFLSALTAIIGSFIPFIFVGQQESFVALLIPITAGGFIYIAGSDLLPELKKQTRLRDTLAQVFAILSGVVIMLVLLLLE
ncbi:MAG: ZIP family metal transporter [Candidatus Komeilibacteria bacterium]